MFGQEFRRSNLIFPHKPAGTVSGEFNIIRRISVDEILRVNRKRLYIAVCEGPRFEQRLQLRKLLGVGDRLVSPERHIKFAAAIETA